MLLKSCIRRGLPWFALALAACDLPNPAGSLPVALQVPPVAGSRTQAATPVGSYAAPNSMPVPGAITSEVPLSPTSIPALPPNSYVLLRISGTLQAERNPYLGGSAGQGQIVKSYSPVQSTESTGRGATNVWLRPSPSSLTRVSYFFRPAANGSDLVLMVRTGAQATEVWAERERMPGAALFYYYCRAGKPYCTPDGPDWIVPDTSYIPLVRTWVEDYWVVSSHVVTATAVAEPLIVEGPTSVAPGKTASFTARAWEDLHLRYPHGQPGDVRWMWYPTDTIDGKPASHLAQAVCASKLSCQFEPKVSGRLRVTSYVEGAQVETERIVRVQQQRMQLTCPDSVQRGSTMNCTVAAVPAGTLDSVRWTFVDSAGNSFRDSLRLSWGGRMVVGGRMSVTAKLNGKPVSADTVIGVQSRGWTSPVPTRREGFQMCPTVTTTCPLLYPPLRFSHLGTTVKQPRSFDLLVRAATIDTGPNAGWSYLSGSDSPVQFREQVIILNGVLNLASGDSVMTQFWAGQPQCVPSSVVKDVRDHENHHADLYERNRHILDAELESTMAFVPAAQWRVMLSAGGPEATRAANRLGELTGGLHRRVDGFAPHSCALNLLP